MAVEPGSDRERALAEAFEHLQQAIRILDSEGAPAQIAAHADLAMRQLGEIIAPEPRMTKTDRRLQE